MSNKVELLSNTDLEELAHNLNINIIQIVPKNLLSVAPAPYGISCYIINLDNVTGSHWTCIFINGKAGWYFDPFGQRPPMAVIQFFTKYRIRWQYNQTQIQALKSKCCGWFCLGFLYWMSQQKKDIWEFLEMFDQLEQENNDRIIQAYIKRIF